MVFIHLPACHDCGVSPRRPHKPGCNVERCSVCGGQRICCACEGHDPLFARWTGFWPGRLEAESLGMDLDEFYRRDFHKVFFIKPEEDTEKTLSKDVDRSGLVLTIWKDKTFKVWDAMSALYAIEDPDHFMSLPMAELLTRPVESRDRE